MTETAAKPAAKPAAKADHRLSYDAIAKLVRDDNASGRSDALLTALIYKGSRSHPTARSKAADSSATGLIQMTRAAAAEVNRVNGIAITFCGPGDLRR